MRVRGSELPMHLQQEAKARFTHRYTGEHRPAWANRPFTNSELKLSTYPVQFRDDADWLAHTYFTLVKDGTRFSKKKRFCESYPTWPDNPELRIRKS